MDKPAFPTAETEKMLRLPVGAFSPLWLMFAGAATVGAAWYWSRAFFKPTNLEALLVTPEAAADAAVEAVEAVTETVVEATVETVETAAEIANAVIEATPEPVVELVAAIIPEPVAPADPDDLTVLTGIGPKLAASLAERGVTRFAQIATWTDEDVAGFDKDMKLMGRIGREAWIAQATRLAR